MSVLLILFSMKWS